MACSEYVLYGWHIWKAGVAKKAGVKMSGATRRDKNSFTNSVLHPAEAIAMS